MSAQLAKWHAKAGAYVQRVHGRSPTNERMQQAPAALSPAAPTAPATVTTPKVAASPLADLHRLVAAQPAPPPARVRKAEVDAAEFVLESMRRCGAKV